MKAVNHNRFNNASLCERGNFVCRYGKFIDRSTNAEYHNNLYVVRNEFIVVIYEIASEQIIDIWMLDFEDLSDYVAKVDLSDLYVRKFK